MSKKVLRLEHKETYTNSGELANVNFWFTIDGQAGFGDAVLVLNRAGNEVLDVNFCGIKFEAENNEQIKTFLQAHPLIRMIDFDYRWF